MQIGEFTARMGTTKETIRHYEDLGLLTPGRRDHRRCYGEKEVLDFQVVRELKALGMGLKEIQLLFELKRAYGCGAKELVSQTMVQLTDHLDMLRQEEAALRLRISALEQQLEELKRV